MVEPNYKLSQAADEPINHRAWTLQERLLSPRVVIYGRDEMVWHCQSETVSESGADIFPHAHINYRLAHSTGSVVSESKVWKRLVQDCTSRALTNPVDRFPAVSGLAREIHSRTGDDYLAGLWRHTLLTDLLWRRDYLWGHLVHAAKPSAYRAPTWSWACYEGSVTYALASIRTKRYHTEVVRCTVDLAGQDPFGMVSGGELAVSGEVKQASYIYHDGVGDRLVDSTRSKNSQELGSAWIDSIDAHSSRDWAERLLTPWCLRVSDQIGILLEPVNGHEGAHSRRIGVFYLLDNGVGWFGNSKKREITIL